MNWRIESGTYVLRGEFLQDRFQFHNYLHNRNRRHVAASTQNVALCALLFLYRQVLKINLPLIENVERPNVRSACQLSSHPGRSGTYWQIFTAYT
ncbi:MAG: phage integrase N-terminal SAM-like domain-containing protein [Pyrinomonadaceae bacterium]